MSTPVEQLLRRWLCRGRYVSRTIDTPHGQLHYYDTGLEEGPTLVALHGLSSGATLMGPVLAKLTRRFGRVIAPDMPGHGFSDAPTPLTIERLYATVSQFLSEVVTGPVVIFGHSLGGAVALRFALDHPERVQGLILLSPAGAPSPEAERESWLERFRMVDYAAATSFVRGLYVRRPVYLPVVAGACRWLFHRPPIRQLVGTIRRDALIVFSEEELRGVEVPIRFIWGGAERTMLEAHKAFWLANLPPQAEIFTPSHFTHCPYLEFPGEVAGFIDDFRLSSPSQAEVAA